MSNQRDSNFIRKNSEIPLNQQELQQQQQQRLQENIIDEGRTGINSTALKNLSSIEYGYDSGDEADKTTQESFASSFPSTPDLSDVNNLRIPQIHLPPRLVPGNAWRHHHQATVQFVQNRFEKRDDDVEEAKPKPKIPLSLPEEGEKNNPVKAIFSNLLPNENEELSSNEKSGELNQGENDRDYDPGTNPLLVSSKPEWKKLENHAEYIETTHLRDLLKDPVRSNELYAEHNGVYLDFSRQRITIETLQLLIDLAKSQNLQGKIHDMMNGEKINFTEDRAVLHTALRAKREQIGTVFVDGVDVIKEVYDVLDQIKLFTGGVRSGDIRGYTGKRLRNIVSVGIGGSYLGPEFLHEVLKTEPEGINAALGYSLRFLSNVDPVDVQRTCADLDPEETLIVIVSKTFTTAETMLNARTMRQWLWDFMGNDKEVVRKHVIACSSVSATEKVEKFGIDTENYFFRFWDWVGGRYSVCSAAGAIPISLLYGYDLFEKFLEGARSMDEHYATAELDKNIPILMGLLGVWNMSFLKYNTRTTLPYAEALLKLPAHIQQLDMESNGKHMTCHNIPVDYLVGEIDFGEPGTNGQHSFYQLLHMGQTVPCEFIGFVQSQHDLCLDDESLSSHDELMANFFAQPDALANGKTSEEVRREGKTAEDLIPHKVFEGNRPSLSLLFPKLTAYATGQILALYEHRTATQGFIWDINSFDQWGVELGKKLALDVKEHILEARSAHNDDNEDRYRLGVENQPATTRILNYYIDNSQNSHCSDEESSDVDGIIVNQKTVPGRENIDTKVTRKTFHEQNYPPIGHDLAGSNGKLS